MASFCKQSPKWLPIAIVAAVAAALLIIFVVILGDDDPPDPPPPVTGENLVDERFELVALVFRLAGHPEYAVAESDYQGYGEDYEGYHRALAAFEEYKGHPAVEYASTLLYISGSDVVRFPFHIKEDLSGLVDDRSAMAGGFGDWSQVPLEEFYSLVMDFYRDTGFGEFYRSNTKFYESLSAPFANNEIISGLDMDWWVTTATRFDTSTQKLFDFHYVVSPSIHAACMNAWSSDAVYAAMVAVVGRYDNNWQVGELLVHEYNHSFGTGAGIDAYMTIERFAEWVEASSPGYDTYADPLTNAVEYMVRGYTILYFADHGYDDVVALCIERDKSFGFTYIEEVYGLVRELEGRG